MNPWRICLKPPNHWGGEGLCWQGRSRAVLVCPHMCTPQAEAVSDLWLYSRPVWQPDNTDVFLEEMNHKFCGHGGLPIWWLCCPEVSLLHLRWLLQLGWEDQSLQKGKSETKILSSCSMDGLPKTKERGTRFFRTASFWWIMKIPFWSCCLPPSPPPPSTLSPALPPRKNRKRPPGKCNPFPI